MEICVICHGEDQLIATPCDCRGSHGKIHAACLEILRRQPAYASYCPVCSTPWKDRDLPLYYDPLFDITASEAQVICCALGINLILPLSRQLGSPCLAGIFVLLLFEKIADWWPFPFDDYVTNTFAYAQTYLNLQLISWFGLFFSELISWPWPSQLIHNWQLAIFKSLLLCAVPILLQVLWRIDKVRRAAKTRNLGRSHRAATLLTHDQRTLCEWRRRLAIQWAIPAALVVAKELDENVDLGLLQRRMRAYFPNPQINVHLLPYLATRQGIAETFALPMLKPNWQQSWWLIAGALIIPTLWALFT